MLFHRKALGIDKMILLQNKTCIFFIIISFILDAVLVFIF